MKIGVILPTFRIEARDALDVAQRCEELGLDGVFVYDHLWPMGAPTRPSLAPFPVLAAVTRRCPSLVVGPLVARVGMVGTRHLVAQFRSLAHLAPERVIAAIGTGDSKSRDELEGYGLEFAGADERRALVEAAATALRDEMTVWIGAGAAPTNDLARRLGVTLNVWDADLEATTGFLGEGPVTWAGPAPENLAGWLDQLEAVGVAWAVLAPGADLETVANWRRQR